MLPLEGKTFTACNLAKTIANVGQKTLLIDMDVRNPTVHKMLNIKNENGLSSFIKKEKSWNECKVTYSDKLDVMVAGNIASLFSGLIFSDQAMHFLEDLKKEEVALNKKRKFWTS